MRPHNSYPAALSGAPPCYRLRPLSETQRIPVEADDFGMMLLDYLERRWPDVHRAYFRRLVLAGLVRVNRIVGTQYTRLRDGDFIDMPKVEGALPPRKPGPVRKQPVVELRHRDDALAVFDKPAGVKVHDAAEQLGLSGWTEGLRSDEAASGLVVMVPSAAAAVAFAKEVAAGKASITWAALVQGNYDADMKVIDRPLGPDRRRPGMVRVYDGEQKRARPAVTEVEVVERFVRHTLLHCTPRTDRGHQLRAHLAATHHPVVGDEAYGGKPALKISAIKRDYKVRVGLPERPMLARLSLHAVRVRVARDGGDLEFSSPLPYDIEKALVRLRRYAKK